MVFRFRKLAVLKNIICIGMEICLLWRNLDNIVVIDSQICTISVQQLIHLYVFCDSDNNCIITGAMQFALENYHLYYLAKTVSDFEFNNGIYLN